MNTAADDVPNIYYIESLEQLRAIADELRLRILDQLMREPLTVTQLGERLGTTPAKVHYHVGELVRVGLARLVRTRENRGILEKYYRAAGRDIRISEGVLRHLPPDEVVAATSDFLRFLTRGYLDAMSRGLSASAAESSVSVGLMSATLWMTSDEQKELAQRVSDLLKPFENPRGIAGEHERIAAYLSYPIAGGGDSTPDGHDQHSETAQPHAGEPQRRHILAGGVFTYSRADLEGSLAQGYQLDISCAGVVIFAADVTADLAERAIGRLRLAGKLIASPEVRAVLKRKQQEA
ncbi:MAG: helix-turn-helix domain-containing protein [Ktedonobacterales bacterium]